MSRINKIVVIMSAILILLVVLAGLILDLVTGDD
jgi:hypothetical protein